MKTQFSLFDLLILIGIIQGIITGALLLKSTKNKRSNIFLSLSLFSFCFLSSKTILHTLNLWNIPFFRFFPIGVELAIPPLIFFYVKSLVNPNFKFRTNDWLHFIPFFISQSYAFIVYFFTLKTNKIYEKDSIANLFNFNTIKQIDEYFLLLSLLIYLYFGFRQLIVYKKWVANNTSDNTIPNFKWLERIFYLFVVIGVFLLINLFIDAVFNFRNTTILHWDLLILLITATIYYLGFSGLLQPDYSFTIKQQKLKKANNPLKKQKEDSILNNLNTAIHTQKIFLNPTLNIDKLAGIIGVTSRDLSKFINQNHNKSFRDYINEHRINEVKLKLKTNDFTKKSILGIATECGFNSEASFYRVFKKVTKKSPLEYVKDNQ